MPQLLQGTRIELASGSRVRWAVNLFVKAKDLGGAEHTIICGEPRCGARVGRREDVEDIAV